MSSLYYNEEDRPKSTPINAQHIFLEDECLVVPHGVILPQVCLVTGDTVDTAPLPHAFRQKTGDITSGVPIPHGLSLFALIFARSIANSATISYCLSPRIVALRKRLRVAGIIQLVVAIPLPAFMADSLDNGWWLVMTPIFLISGMLTMWWRDRYARAEKVTSSYVWLTGVNKAVREAIYEEGKKHDPKPL